MVKKKKDVKPFSTSTHHAKSSIRRMSSETFDEIVNEFKGANQADQRARTARLLLAGLCNHTVLRLEPNLRSGREGGREREREKKKKKEKKRLD